MDVDKYAKKLERQEKVQVSRYCAEWLDKMGKDFLEKEKRDILHKLEFAMPGELPGVQARYKEIIALKNRLNSIMNDGKSSERKIHKENRRE